MKNLKLKNKFEKETGIKYQHVNGLPMRSYTKWLEKKNKKIISEITKQINTYKISIRNFKKRLELNPNAVSRNTWEALIKLHNITIRHLDKLNDQ